MPAELLPALLNFGGLGILVAYLMYREGQLQKEQDRKDAEIMAYNKARLEVDRQMAANIAALTVVIQQGTRHAHE